MCCNSMITPGFWAAAVGGGGPAPEDYLVHLNGFADKAAALAFYAGDGVTINDVVQVPIARNMFLMTTYDPSTDPHGAVLPDGPAGANPQTPYMLYSGFEASPTVFTINISAAMQIKSLVFDFGHNNPSGMNILLNYSGGESRSVFASPSVISFPMNSTTIPAPGVLAAASYLTLITFTTDQGRFAWDNMLLKVT